MSSLMIRSTLACRLVRYDKDRFNEAVSRGDYPCAPTVMEGRTRIFSIPQVITLFIFARMLERGMAPALAGARVCEMGAYIRDIERLKYDDNEGSYNGLVLKDAFAEERVSGALDQIGVASIETTMGWHAALTGVVDDKLKMKITAVRMQLVSPCVGAFGPEAVINQQNWNVANIRSIIIRGIEDYRNTLGEEEAIG